ncbi:MAG: hypothetical protein PHU21_14760 [Elusimicrobia bacterium]|nr:hypothetical protein [Elusimicrobiota bacterium]
MKTLLSAIAAALLAAPALAAPTLESAQAAAEKSFQSLPALKLSFQKGARVQGALPGKIVTSPAKQKTSSTVHISGYVSFNGSGFVSHTPGYASLNVSGSANLCDSSGQVCSGYTTITTWANLFVNGDFVNDWVRPYVNVSFYKAGRYVGSAQLSGSVPVSGWVSGNWVHVSGSGYLSGSVLVTE